MARGVKPRAELAGRLGRCKEETYSQKLSCHLHRCFVEVKQNFKQMYPIQHNDLLYLSEENSLLLMKLEEGKKIRHGLITNHSNALRTVFSFLNLKFKVLVNNCIHCKCID